MKVSIETARKMLEEIYKKYGLDDESMDWLVELALDMDLEGNFFN